MAQTAQPHSTRRTPPPKNDVIQIRASASMKAILTRAASLRGQKLSEFMLDSARREAEDAILDKRTFFLDAEQHEQFLATLDSSPAPSEQLKKLMQRKPSWER